MKTPHFGWLVNSPDYRIILNSTELKSFILFYSYYWSEVDWVYVNFYFKLCENYQITLFIKFCLIRSPCYHTLGFYHTEYYGRSLSIFSHYAPWSRFVTIFVEPIPPSPTLFSHRNFIFCLIFRKFGIKIHTNIFDMTIYKV